MTRRPRRLLVAGGAAVVSCALMLGVRAQEPPSLEPTNHPILPTDIRQLWLAPANGRPAARSGVSGALSTGLALFDKGEFAKALPYLSQPAVRRGAIGDYATYYSGVALVGLKRPAEARRVFKELQAEPPVGYLAEAAALGEASAAEALEDYGAAVQIYERLTKQKTVAPVDVLMRLARAARAAGDEAKATETFARIYYESPTSAEATAAYSELKAVPGFGTITRGSENYKLELARAERLFSARLYAPARAAFETLRPSASGDDRELVALRIAESRYHLRQLRDARDALRPFTERASRQAEALFFYGLAVGDLGDRAAYLKAMRRLADEFPKESWAAEALNHLGSHYIVKDEDDEADAAFRQLYKNNPRGPHAERAAWKIGWRAYRQGRFEETVRYFDQAAADFPRSDYRPSWLYWSGRAHQRLKKPTTAEARFMLTAADYLNSYYGRLAVEAMKGRTPPPRVIGEPATVRPLPANELLVRALIAAGRYAEAVNELRYAQRTWGDSPAVQATLAWVFQQQGRGKTGREGFDLLRGSITLMRRAYPQFMAAGGEQLPREVLTVIFPLSYWDLIQTHAKARDLDPYLVAALMAQESTFVRDIRSSANAVGLMQLMPATGRALARRLGLRYSASLLTNAEANIRMGTLYLSDKITEFGGVHLALASYNAGETPVYEWMEERRGVTDVAEFIDDIPYPETQNYVKRLLGTAEDYRRLYSE